MLAIGKTLDMKEYGVATGDKGFGLSSEDMRKAAAGQEFPLTDAGINQIVDNIFALQKEYGANLYGSLDGRDMPKELCDAHRKQVVSSVTVLIKADIYKQLSILCEHSPSFPAAYREWMLSTLVESAWNANKRPATYSAKSIFDWCVGTEKTIVKHYLALDAEVRGLDDMVRATATTDEKVMVLLSDQTVADAISTFLEFALTSNIHSIEPGSYAFNTLAHHRDTLLARRYAPLPIKEPIKEQSTITETDPDVVSAIGQWLEFGMNSGSAYFLPGGWAYERLAEHLKSLKGNC